MKKRIISISLFILLIAYGLYAQIQLTSSNFSMTGGITQSGSFSLVSSIGQPSPIGTAVSSPINLGSGYIYAAMGKQIISVATTPVTTSTENSPISISTSITNYTSTPTVELRYRKGGESAFTSVGMVYNSGVYEGAIPASAVTSRGVEYFIMATDLSGSKGRNPATGVIAVPVTIGGQGISRGIAQVNGTAQNAYRLFSIPVNANDKLPSAVLADDLSAYNNTVWRCYELKSDQTYVEYPNTSNMMPGKAFWLIVKDGGKIIDTGPGTSIITNQTYKKIPMDTGWTLIGNPFHFAIPLSKLSRKSGQVLDIREYNTAWGTLTSSIQPFEGYAVSNLTGSKDTLFIDPQVYSPQEFNPPTIEPVKPSENSWAVRILAKCQQAQDVDNEILVSSIAKSELDEMDKPEPPTIGEYISVYFPHPEWNRVFKRYSTDARSEPANGDVWDIEVRSNIKDKITLEFDGIEGVKAEFNLMLVDKFLKTTRDLRKSNSYSFVNSDENHPRQLMIIVGNGEYIQQKLMATEMLPTSFELYQNFPNPFNPNTTIRFALPAESRVRLTIYNSLLQKVTTLIEGVQQNVGYQQAIWDASGFASGVYFYRIEAASISDPRKSFTQVKKMLLLK